MGDSRPRSCSELSPLGEGVRRNGGSKRWVDEGAPGAVETSMLGKGKASVTGSSSVWKVGKGRGERGEEGEGRNSAEALG